MKVRVSFTIDIDAEAWASEYGVDRSEVRKDVQSYLEHIAYQHTANLGLVSE